MGCSNMGGSAHVARRSDDHRAAELLSVANELQLNHRFSRRRSLLRTGRAFRLSPFERGTPGVKPHLAGCPSCRILITGLLERYDEYRRAHETHP